MKMHIRPASLRCSIVIVWLASAAGCTSLLGLDEDYTVGGISAGGSASTGGTSTGGAELDASATGGVVTGGNAGAPNGGRDAANADGGPCGGCPEGTKCCRGLCLEPAPIVGCSLEGCDPCPPPPERGISVCDEQGRCDIQCNAFTARIGDTCETGMTGGAGGAGAAGGAGGVPPTGGAGGVPEPVCDPELCLSCGPVGPFGCCKNNGECGCSWTSTGSLCY